MDQVRLFPQWCSWTRWKRAEPWCGTLVAQQAMDNILALRAQPFQLFDSLQIFVHATQYHWHVKGVGDTRDIDQEVREHIISVTSLLDHFGHQTKQRENFCGLLLRKQ